MKINDLLKKIIHNKFIVSRIINNKAVIFNLKNKKIIHLNQTAAKIWDLINKKQTLPEIVKVISKDYRIFPKEAEKDLIDFLFILFKELTSMKNKSLGESSYIKERDSVYKNILKQAQIKKIPFYSLIELTYNCNLKCRHCYISPLKKEELKLNSILKIIQELKENNCLELTFSGGEPLVRPDFFKILEFAKINNFAITIKTNGTLIDSKIAEEIAQFYPYEVHLSIYSLNSKIHDFITQKPGSLEKTIKSLYFLLEK
ncbi:MAG: radical SAM protein, partial [Armatimonadetes bacterium]|nr:radical SAM protein [Armatimonadota bacterium]